MLDLLREARLAWRALVRRPGLTLAALATLALTIGANTAVFSTAYGLLFRPLPYPASERMVALWPDHFVANREIEFMRRELRTVDGVASVSPGWLMGLTNVATPVEISAERVSGNLFELLGARPLLGRVFGLDAERPGNEQVVVLSHALWRSQFAADPGIIGRSITLNNAPYQVVAVMPRDFNLVDGEADLWYPLTMDPNAQSYAGAITLAFARMKPGGSIAAVDREFKTIARRMGEAFSEPATFAADARAIGMKEHTVASMRQAILLLLIAALIILAIGIANVANLLLVRATERRTEFAVRASLGASRSAMIRQLGFEAMLLSLVGGAFGIGLGLAGVVALRRVLPADTPRLQELTLSWPAIAVSIALIALTAALVSLAPAFLTSTRQLAGQLRAGRTTTGSATRARGLLITTQVALTVVLVCGAMLMLRTVARLNAIDPGFRTDRVLTMRVQPSFAADAGEVRTFWRTLLPRLDALPGVDAVGTVLHLPMSGRKWGAGIVIEGRQLPAGVPAPRASWQAVHGDYFRAFDIPLLRGRAFTDADREDAPRVVLVNDAFARRILAGREAIGVRIRAGNATSNEWATIIGIVGNVRHDSLSVEPAPELYAPLMQKIVFSTSVVLRATGDPRALAASVRDAIWQVNRNVPISNVRTIDDVLRRSIVRRSVILNLLGSSAAVGLLLGLVGIYGLVAYTVRQRQREIGIRMALGARPSDVSRLMTVSGLRWAMLGVGLGTALAITLSRYMESLVFGVPPLDLVTFTVAPIAMLLVSLGASYIPARRAGLTHPSQVLHE
jgi:putative ABC transport system permease protein